MKENLNAPKYTIYGVTYLILSFRFWRESTFHINQILEKKLIDGGTNILFALM